ncbi:hypothetical protein EON65_05575 [archaeon]|nr:MAG: hypothetical protein EON65_05575 [archaeon]
MNESKSSVTANLRRVVDWKLFELSAVLISEESTEIDLEESRKWFQARHAEEVVEERQCAEICGYPLCNKSLKKLSAKAKFRIDYGNKKIYEIEKSALYCSSNCLERSEFWIRSLDITLPYSRPAAKVLLKDEQSSRIPTGIDDVLNVLNNPTPISPNRSQSGTEDLSSLPPHSYMNQDGSVQVKFENGVPVPIKPPTPPDGMRGSHAPPQSPIPKNSDQNIADIINTMKDLQVKYQLAPPATKPTQPTSLVPTPSPSPSPALASILIDQASMEPSHNKKKKSVEWTDPFDKKPTTSNLPSIQTLHKGAVGLQVMERTDVQPMSVQAIATKKEPSLAYIHRMNYVGTMKRKGEEEVRGIAMMNEKKDSGSIEGYQPKW